MKLDVEEVKTLLEMYVDGFPEALTEGGAFIEEDPDAREAAIKLVSDIFEEAIF